MRISDWSSDVCSSDLQDRGGRRRIRLAAIAAQRKLRALRRIDHVGGGHFDHPADPLVSEAWHDLSARLARLAQIGRASGRERVCQYVSISVVAGSIKKK